MNLKTKLEAVKLPKLLADLKHANQFLKVYALTSSIIGILSLACFFTLLSIYEPKIVVLSPSGEVLSVDQKPNLELQVEAALRKYIQFRYSWDAKTVSENLKLARDFVHPSVVRSFDGDLVEVQKFSKERNVSQRGYASSISIDVAKQMAQVRGDRVTTIQGLTAAGPLALSLKFESGPRTRANPWGIYVVREQNE